MIQHLFANIFVDVDLRRKVAVLGLHTEPRTKIKIEWMAGIKYLALIDKLYRGVCVCVSLAIVFLLFFHSPRLFHSIAFLSAYAPSTFSSIRWIERTRACVCGSKRRKRTDRQERKRNRRVKDYRSGPDKAGKMCVWVDSIFSWIGFLFFVLIFTYVMRPIGIIEVEALGGFFRSGRSFRIGNN